MTDMGRATLEASLAALEHRLVGAGGPFELRPGVNGAPSYAGGPRALTDLYARARKLGEKPLLARGDDRQSYGEVFGPAFALAERLSRQGWAGRRIALALDDGAEWLVWFVAITAAGASCVLPPPGASDERVSSCCEAAGCDAVVAPLDHSLARGGLKNLKDDGWAGLEAGSIPDVAPEAEAIVAFTSGSSGSPKGVAHTHRSLVTGLRNMMLGGTLANRMLPVSSAAPERPQAPSTLVLSPLAYVAGYSAFLLSVATGGRIVLPEETDDDVILSTIRTEGVQALGGMSPALLRRLVRRPEGPQALRSLRRLQLHGSALQQSLVEELRDLVPAAQLFTGYGASETAGSIAMAAVDQIIDQAGGCGRLLPSVQLRVVDEAGAVVPAGVHGALQVRGDMVMAGYLDPARTGQAMTADGWYRTGDIGRLEDGAWLSVIGRSEDRIAGATGFVTPVEEAVRAACEVEDAAVTSSIDGRVLILYLQARPSQAVDRDGALAAVKSAAGWAGAVDIRLLDAFPRTASGKIDRLRLDA
jgi:acyl-CoA synthetase (AMP-forming)/AMP-acid ligase II